MHAESVMDMGQALKELGAGAEKLSSEQKSKLDNDGFIEVRHVIPAEQCATMVKRLDAIAAEEGERAGKDFHTEKGAVRLGSLISKDPIFDICFLHPLGLAAVAHIMGDDFGLSSITSRTAEPGEGLQGLHCDFNPDRGLKAANVLWLMDDFTPQNGPTRLVPGTHKLNAHPFMKDQPQWKPDQPHPNEIKVIAPRGTMVVINAMTWHGGTKNLTDGRRHLISAFFTQRGQYQPISDRRLLPDAQRRLSPAQKYVLDHVPSDGSDVGDRSHAAAGAPY